MLEDIHIENYALIENLSLEFSSGMNTLTGETGAGKSILTGALSLLLGAMAGSSVVRNGTKQAVVSGTFRVSHSSPAQDWLAENSIEAEENRVIIRRVIKITAKGSAYIQNTPVSRQQLREFTSILIDMHGQHEHQSLFNINYHRRFIDAFGNCHELQQKVQRDFLYLNEKREELKALRNDKKERKHDADLLRFAIKEIQESAPRLAEDSELEEEQQKLQQYETLFAHAKTVYNELGSGLTALYTGMNAVKQVAAIDPSQKENSERLSSLYYELEDIRAQLRSYKDALNFEPSRVEFIGDRLAELSRLKKKYGPRITDVLNYVGEAEQKLERFEHAEDYSQELVQEIRTVEKGLMENAVQLSRDRKKAALLLDGEVQKSLSALGMQKAVFKAQITQRLSDRKVPLCGQMGIDRVEFLLSANQGEPLKPLKDIASGGEISRVMLAIKNALAENDDIPILVFDEIDSGIGGEVGRALGEHLSILSRSKQLFCITHLASIAVFAETHIQVSKHEEGGRTITSAHQVTGEDRVREIARMLSGYSSEKVSFQHAEQLLENASKYRG